MLVIYERKIIFIKFILMSITFDKQICCFHFHELFFSINNFLLYKTPTKFR